MNITLTDITAFSALILSCYVAKKQFRFNKVQEKALESQKKLHELQIEIENLKLSQIKKAELNARVIRLGTANYRIKIWNQGEGIATNVRVEVSPKSNFLMPSELKEKFPFEELGKHGSIELCAAVDTCTRPKECLEIYWDDDSGKDNHKKAYLTF